MSGDPGGWHAPAGWPPRPGLAVTWPAS